MLKLYLQTFAEEKPEEPEKEEPEKVEPEKAEPEKEEPEKAEPEKAEAHDSSKLSEIAAKVGHLEDLVKLVTEKTEKTFEAAKDTKEIMAEAAAELKETTALLQSLIGEIDNVVQALGTATAALIKMHKEQTAKN